MILVVDDHADSAELLRRMFARYGMPAEVAHNSREAMAAAKARHPAVIVMDEMMPEMSGIETVRMMRQDPELRDVKVVFYSAAFEWSKQREAEELGAKPWLVKGVARMPELTRAVVAAIQSGNAERRLH
jgi:CheY-like chemotaxis protein